MNSKLNSWWNPDIRPENITDYEETYTTTNEAGEEQTQTETYKFVKSPLIIDKILNKLSFIWTHAGCVWYNKLANRTVKDELDALNAKIPHIESGTVNVQFSTTARTYNVTFKNAFVDPPVVQLTVQSGQLGAHARALLNGNPATTGFKFISYDNDSETTSGVVHWLAVDRS